MIFIAQKDQNAIPGCYFKSLIHVPLNDIKTINKIVCLDYVEFSQWNLDEKCYQTKRDIEVNGIVFDYFVEKLNDSMKTFTNVVILTRGINQTYFYFSSLRINREYAIIEIIHDYVKSEIKKFFQMNKQWD